MATVLFIGLGTMGAPMAHRLIADGHRVWAADASVEAVQRFVDETGVRPWDGYAVPDGLDVLLMMLPNSDVVESVLGSTEDTSALISRLPQGTLVLDMGSSNPDSTKQIAARLRDRGVQMVDAPVSGGPVKAASGELAIMIGGAQNDDVWDCAMPLLRALGTSITRTGPVGSAHALKALNNLLSAIGIVGAVEVLQVGTKFGLDPGIMLEVINHSTGRNQATEVKLGPQVLDRGWNVGFSLKLTVKDISTALALAESCEVDAPVSHAAAAVARAALNALPETADQSQIAEYLEMVNNVTLARR